VSGGAGAGWQPVAEEATDVVSPGVAAAMHGLLDSPGDPPGAGDPLPPLWHWLAFLPRVPQRELGADGHPRTGGFLPPVEGRRMWAGSRVSFAGALGVGEPLRRRSEVSAVEEKEGRSGRLVFVTVDTRIGPDGGDGGEAPISETQDIVYRPVVDTPGGSDRPPGSGSPSAPASPSAARAPAPDEETWDWGFELVPDPTMLFRFSALTYNAHRIHYDRTYATEVEGYPGLVVHGPLQAIALAELCRQHTPDRRLRSFRFRGLRPAFDGNPLRLRGRLGDDGVVTLAALDHRGDNTMQAEAVLDRAAG
jgi:3-methylfumaryl-CoA hydratase